MSEPSLNKPYLNKREDGYDEIDESISTYSPSALLSVF